VCRAGAARTRNRFHTASAAESLSRDRGSELLEINVDGEDIDARRFYERHGYYYYYRDLSG
jgi:hypothetical protein